jgi:UDP-2,3-diacylglucosamine pyrophosphatase LpxH
LLESEAFLRAFGTIPGPLARGLETLLDRSNEAGRLESDRRHLEVYRRYADQLGDRADVVVFGHIHRPLAENSRRPSLYVLGGWQTGESYLKIDEAGPTLVVESDHQEPAS